MTMTNLERIFFINSTIKEKGKVSTQEITHKFEIDSRTVKRDIEFMKSRLSVPIEYSAKEKGYIYRSTFYSLDLYDDKMFLSYIMIKNILKSNNYAPVISDIILKEIESLLPREYKSISDDVIYEVSEYDKITKEVFLFIMESMMQKERIAFEYQKSSGKVENRTIEPLKLIHSNGKWYILGNDTDKNLFRIFSLARISKPTKTAIHFWDKKPSEEIDPFLDKSFGINKNSEVRMVRIRFYHPLTIRIKSQIWHKDQKVTSGTSKRGEYIDFEIPVGFEDELIGRVLRHGAMAEILEPDDIRQKWLETIREMASKNGIKL